MMVGCFLAAIAAMAFGREWLAMFLFVAGLIIGSIELDRERRRAEAADAERRLRQEIRRHPSGSRHG